MKEYSIMDDPDMKDYRDLIKAKIETLTVMLRNPDVPLDIASDVLMNVILKSTEAGVNHGITLQAEQEETV